MTNACPRCGTPLNGPVCAACGIRVDAPAPPPPGGWQGGAHGAPGYPAHAPHPTGAPMAGPIGGSMPAPVPGASYIGPDGRPYVMVPVRPQRSSTKWATTGGIMSIVTSSLHLLIVLAAIAGASNDGDLDEPGAIVGIGLFFAFAVGGIVSGILAVKAKWGGALAGGILHTIATLLFLLGMIGVQMAAEEAERRGGIGPDREEINAMMAVAVVFALLSLLSAIFCYAGISGAKAARSQAARVDAAQAF